MSAQISNNIAVPMSFPIQQEDSSSDYVNIVLLGNILSRDYSLTAISMVLNKCEMIDDTLVYINNNESLHVDHQSEEHLKNALFNLSSKNLKSFLEEEKNYGPIF